MEVRNFASLLLGIEKSISRDSGRHADLLAALKNHSSVVAAVGLQSPTEGKYSIIIVPYYHACRYESEPGKVNHCRRHVKNGQPHKGCRSHGAIYNICKCAMPLPITHRSCAPWNRKPNQAAKLGHKTCKLCPCATSKLAVSVPE
jgi:hypothetical protein